MPRLRIAINAQLNPEKDTGGVLSVVSGLIHALGSLQDGDEEYVIIGLPDCLEWWRPLLGPNQTLVTGPTSSAPFLPQKSTFWQWVFRKMRPFFREAKLKLADEQVAIQPHFQISVPISNGFYEGLACQVIHFPWQPFTLCALPTIYNPHDLQHLNFPQFFSPSSIAWRESFYYFGCRFSNTVVVASDWVKQDIIRHYGIFPGKIQIIPWAPPTTVFSSPTDDTCLKVKEKYNLPNRFAFYPAMTWEHKNHLRLVEAQALLRDQFGVNLAVVCSGRTVEPMWAKIEKRINELKLNDLFFHIGVVPGDELRAVYRLAQFVIVPTLFEAMSGPIFEAWQERTPVTCSKVTSLPEQVGKSAILFDPYSVISIAEAMLKMCEDEDLRNNLVTLGNERLELFNWTQVSKAYRAVYRRAAHVPLTDEDQSLLGHAADN